jgi:predicted HTH domain antitoxin
LINKEIIMENAVSSSFQEMEIEAIVDAGIFKHKSDVLREAINTFFAVKPKMRLEAAIQLFRDKKVTLGRAAEIAGIDLWQLKDILGDRGINIVVECDDSQEMDRRISSLLRK